MTARFDPAPLRARAIRDGWVHRQSSKGGFLAGKIDVPSIAAKTPWTVETVGSLLRADRDANGRRAEGLTWWQADRLAVAIGCHPVEIWGSDWLAAAGGQDFDRSSSERVLSGSQEAAA